MKRIIVKPEYRKSNAYQAPIATDDIQAPYQEYRVTLDGNQQIEIFRNFNSLYFERIPDNYFAPAQQDNYELNFKFGNSHENAKVTGLTLGLKLDNVVDRIIIRNATLAFRINFALILALGEIPVIRYKPQVTTGTVDVPNTVTTTTRGIVGASGGQVSIGTSATNITFLEEGASCLVHAGTLDLFISDSAAVTASTGFKIPANTTISIAPCALVDLYGIRALGTANASFLSQPVV